MQVTYALVSICELREPFKSYQTHTEWSIMAYGYGWMFDRLGGVMEGTAYHGSWCWSYRRYSISWVLMLKLSEVWHIIGPDVEVIEGTAYHGSWCWSCRRYGISWVLMLKLWKEQHIMGPDIEVVWGMAYHGSLCWSYGRYSISWVLMLKLWKAQHSMGSDIEVVRGLAYHGSWCWSYCSYSLSRACNIHSLTWRFLCGNILGGARAFHSQQ